MIKDTERLLKGSKSVKKQNKAVTDYKYSKNKIKKKNT